MRVYLLDIDGTQYREGSWRGIISSGSIGWDPGLDGDTRDKAADRKATLQLRDALNIQREHALAKVVHVTGRPLPDIEKIIQPDASCIAQPDALIGYCSTAIYTPGESGWVYNRKYHDHLARTISPENVAELRDQFRRLGQVGVAQFHDGLVSPFQIVFEFKDANQYAQAERDVLSALENSGVNSLKPVWLNPKMFVLNPVNSSKAAAGLFLLNEWNMRDAEIYASGDGLNDLELLRDRCFRGIVPGNAQPELVARLRQGDTGHLYFVPDQLHAAEAVLEGMRYYGVLDSSSRSGAGRGRLPQAHSQAAIVEATGREPGRGTKS